MAERKAREAAAATADMAAAAEERVAAVEERAAAANERLVCHTEFIVELAVLCDCVSELEEENMDLQRYSVGVGCHRVTQSGDSSPCGIQSPRDSGRAAGSRSPEELSTQEARACHGPKGPSASKDGGRYLHTAI